MFEISVQRPVCISAFYQRIIKFNGPEIFLTTRQQVHLSHTNNVSLSVISGSFVYEYKISF